MDSYGYTGHSPHLIRALNDFTRPTKCFYCNREVFFVRHNGGSVWFDHLGAPWPKHACYYSGTVAHTSFKDMEVILGIEQWLARLYKPVVGVVVDTAQDKLTDAKAIRVHCNDNTEIALRVYVPFGLDGFKGEFVIFSSQEGVLIRPFLSLTSVILLKQPIQQRPAQRSRHRRRG